MIGNGVTNWTYDTQPAYFDMTYWHSIIGDDMFDDLIDNRLMRLGRFIDQIELIEHRVLDFDTDFRRQADLRLVGIKALLVLIPLIEQTALGGEECLSSLCDLQPLSRNGLFIGREGGQHFEQRDFEPREIGSQAVDVVLLVADLLQLLHESDEQIGRAHV